MTAAPAPEGAVVQLAVGKHSLRLDAVERVDDRIAFEVRVSVGRFSATSACDVRVPELLAWRDALERLHETLSGTASLQQPRLRIGLAGDGTGHLTVEGEVDSEVGWGDGSRAVLHFRLPVLDQSHLPPVVVALDEALALEPAPEDELWA